MRGISENQHGFSPGRSTMTALLDILKIVKTSDTKYVQAIFLDISGAFDNAWWPMTLVKAKRGGCLPNIYRMLRDYFSNRRVCLYLSPEVFWKASTMGCPQGSVLGPTLWNVLMDDLLRLPLPDGVRIVAYADDVSVLIGAESRIGIETKARDTLRLISEWGGRNRLEFSPSKSQTMTMKGRFQRPPIIRLSGNPIRAVASATVLGVVIDASLSFAQHAASIVERASRCFGKLSRMSAASWGIRYGALRVLYRGTFVATVTYGAGYWVDRVETYVARSTLLRGQRPALVLLTKAYRSVSTAALPVLAGVLPADLEVTRAGRLDLARLQATKAEIRARKRGLWDEIIAVWQERWTNETRGRELHRFFPDVAVRLSSDWVSPDYETSQILTGHGCFRKRLNDMKLCDTSVCFCGMEDEDMYHILWSCPLYAEMRMKMMNGITREDMGPIYYTDLVSCKTNFDRLVEFARAWHRLRGRLEEDSRRR
ncbi:Retrovirus-related Pol polyprotein from type-1 retrotransposable element R1 [Eumeta japonica]|uniref:Retrovirus-related Pol polyprotein from type-1 retrotransposable element R1 n=1 Tax=Eumeta variegata TaxID=151549 RepID=A0A4C1ZPU3_EUMVA|nr:Retrovirus-related Pol polyprotein from type-1 retrotransposable element R1 [Eumeta japonica]